MVTVAGLNSPNWKVLTPAMIIRGKTESQKEGFGFTRKKVARAVPAKNRRSNL